LRPDLVRDDRFFAGLSQGEDGGREEFVESVPSRRLSSAISSACSATIRSIRVPRRQLHRLRAQPLYQRSELLVARRIGHGQTLPRPCPNQLTHQQATPWRSSTILVTPQGVGKVVGNGQ
jgi:hypothetical protein